MDKKRMGNDKIIDCRAGDPAMPVHRLLGTPPEVPEAYGLWIINSSAACISPADSFLRCPPRRFEFYSLSHLIEGRGRLRLREGSEIDLYPGDLIVISPGTVNRYGGYAGKPYIEDSIRFTGPVADRLLRTGVIADGVYRFGSVRKLLPIAELAADPSRDAQINANLALQKLLVELYNDARQNCASSPVDELVELIKSRPEHWWQVEELAEVASLSTDQLRRNFKRQTGMLPKRYVEELKLRLAAELLISTPLPVGEIATRFGYRDPYHFSRRFKLFTGASPEKYRRESPAAGRRG